LDLAHLSLTLGAMLQSHMVCQRMYRSPLLGRNRSWEDQTLSADVAFEKHEVGVEAKRCGIVQINICTSQYVPLVNNN
jgi:hypothetical protein